MTPERYSEQRGEKPFRVTLLERRDKGLTVWIRWWVGGKPKYRMTKTRTIRDARGRMSKRAIENAQQEADAQIAELKGELPPNSMGNTGPLTLGEGLGEAFSDRGCYPHNPLTDSWTKDARRYANDAVRVLGGEDMLFEEISPGMIRSVWRKLEREGAGLTKAIKTLMVFFRITGWLEGEHPEQRFPRPPKGWRGEAKGYFRKQGHSTEPHQPRYRPEEIRKLFEHLGDADPRLALALVIGVELRGGQVIRSMWSHTDLFADAGFGRIKIPYLSERKRAPVLTLNNLERTALDAAMTAGYLSELEAARETRLLQDYPLFPGGKLRKQKAPLRESLAPMHASSIQDLLHDLEAKAGVALEKGRAWHGLRRAMTDLYPAATTDARLLDLLGGWVPGSKMREGTYQLKENEGVALEAAKLRARFRPGFSE
jgi:hypothetical protein